MRREKVAADGTQGTSIVVCAVTEPARVSSHEFVHNLALSPSWLFVLLCSFSPAADQRDQLNNTHGEILPPCSTLSCSSRCWRSWARRWDSRCELYPFSKLDEEPADGQTSSAKRSDVAVSPNTSCFRVSAPKTPPILPPTAHLAPFL